LLSTPCGGPVNDLQPAWSAHRIEYSTASLYDFLSRYFRTILRPDNGTLPQSNVFDRLQGTGIDYLMRLNPVVCKDPIYISNPYLSEAAAAPLASKVAAEINTVDNPQAEPTQDPAAPAWSYEEISGGGERVTHLYPNYCYYAHLSVYYFATQFCQGGHVLDAGSGGGYGSNYLAEKGAKYVNAVELSEVSVAFSQNHFQKPNLRYQVMNLENITGF